MTAKDYYQILGVKKTASDQEIKKARDRLALKYHPDRQHGESEVKKKQAEEKMAEVNQAYQVLSDKEKRRNYDRYGSESASQQRGYSTRGFQTNGEFSNFFQDIFDIFGERNGYQWQGTRSQTRTQTPTSNDISLSIELTFPESVLGTKKKISLNLEKYCAVCRQQPGVHSPSHIIECLTCRGRGVVKSQSLFGTFQTACSQCQGRGGRFRPEEKKIELNIPRGIRPNGKLRYQEVGHDSWNGEGKGDIYVTVKVQASPYFQRKDNDIHVNLPISFLDAILGSVVKVITLEPEGVKVKEIQVPPKTQNGSCSVLKGRGCYLGIGRSSRGDFYIWWQIKLPEKIGSEAGEILRNLQKNSP